MLVFFKIFPDGYVSRRHKCLWPTFGPYGRQVFIAGLFFIRQKGIRRDKETQKNFTPVLRPYALNEISFTFISTQATKAPRHASISLSIYLPLLGSLRSLSLSIAQSLSFSFSASKRNKVLV